MLYVASSQYIDRPTAPLCGGYLLVPNKYCASCSLQDEVRMIHNSGEKEVFKRKTAEKVKISYPTNRKKIVSSHNGLGLKYKVIKLLEC